jgi:hypothetical protein
VGSIFIVPLAGKLAYAVGDWRMGLWELGVFLGSDTD